jgi:hypothetical protein
VAINPIAPQFARFPLKPQALIQFVPKFAKFPGFSGTTTPLFTPLPVIPFKFQPGQVKIMPKLVGGSTVPIPGGQRIFPIKPLPGSGGGGGGGTVGYGI